MPAPGSKDRQKCYEAKDAYYKCKDAGDENCEELLKKYEEACPSAWVRYFDKKRIYDAYKEKLKNDGAVYNDTK